MSWRIVFAKQAQKDAKKLSASGLRSRAEELIKIHRDNPYQAQPPYEKLVGDLAGALTFNTGWVTKSWKMEKL